MQITHKTIWITGASSGIGEALALALSKHGCRLIISARNVARLEAVRGQCQENGSEVLVVPMDVSRPEQIESAWQTVQESGYVVDVLINNSGISQRSMALETPIEMDRKIMDVNYFGSVYLTKLVAPTMVTRGTGTLVAISSLAGKFGWKTRSAYAASKFALLGFFESLRAELSENGVQVLTVIPGRIRTDISLHAITKDGSAFGQMDPAQKGGISASDCADRIVQAIISNKKELKIMRIEGLMIHIRYWAPWLYYRIAAKRDPNK